MITPNDIKTIEAKKVDIDKIIKEIDISITKTHGDYPWEEAIINGEYSDDIMYTILKKYYNVGWKYIYWSRSSEDNERAGLTGIMFSTTPIENEIYIQNKHIFNL